MLPFHKFEEWFVAAWCVVMPITGFVLFPSVQGTIPAYLLAFASVLLVLARVRAGELGGPVLRYFKCLLGLFLLWLLLMVGSQLELIVSHRHDFGDVPLVQPELDPVVFRPTLFTQSLYLLPCVLTTLYFRYFFQEAWMRYVYWGGYFLAVYGIYEWTYFLIFHETGDFLANRMFGDHPGSWSQSVDFGGVQLLRIKSTLGEPTFFTAVALPYFYLALDGRKRVLSGLLLFAAVFTVSTACYIVLAFTQLVKSFWTGRPRATQLFILLLVGGFVAGLAMWYPDVFRGVFEEKISGDNESGADRLAGNDALSGLFDSFTPANWIFGIGFGYVYSDIYHGLLMNTGVIGLGFFLWFFGRALWFLPVTPGYEGHKAGLLALMTLCGLSLSELFLPTTWMFIGLAYFKLDRLWKSRAEIPPGVLPALAPSERPAAQTRLGP